MKYLILGTALLILCIPPIILGIINFTWKPTKQGFTQGSLWLDKMFDYGKILDNILDEMKS